MITLYQFAHKACCDSMVILVGIDWVVFKAKSKIGISNEEDTCHGWSGLYRQSYGR